MAHSKCWRHLGNLARSFVAHVDFAFRYDAGQRGEGGEGNLAARGNQRRSVAYSDLVRLDQLARLLPSARRGRLILVCHLKRQ